MSGYQAHLWRRMKFDLLLSFILVQLAQHDRAKMAGTLRHLADEIDPELMRRNRNRERQLRRLRRKPRPGHGY